MIETKFVLFGYLNIFELIPDFVYPIYFCQNKLYFADGDAYTITSFVEVKGSMIHRVQAIATNEKIIRKVGDKQIYIYLLAGKSYLVGTGEEVYRKMKYLPKGQLELRADLLDFYNDYAKIINSHIQFYGTGRRKKSIARVYLVPGTGKITINKRDIDEYLCLQTLRVIVRQPLVATRTEGRYDVLVNVHGGGTSGQAGAIRHGISRALLQADANHKPVLKKEGYLTRDSRMKERKKYGLKGARRAPQYSKR